MAVVTLSATPHVGTGTNPLPCSSTKTNNKLRPVSCSALPPSSRRSLSLSLSLALSHLLFAPENEALAAGFDNYVKRKKLDPLEAYVSPVILTQLQIKDLEKSLEGDQPQFSTCRSLLRSGPAATLRVNIRAVAQYASDSGDGKAASTSVDQCLRALEELDNLLFRATRNDPGASVTSMKTQADTALIALDSLLKTVPSDVLDKGKIAADNYRSSLEDADVDIADPELKELQSIL